MIKKNRIGGKLTSILIDLPVPYNISNFWNFGSCLGLCLGLQLFTGLFLARHYNSSPEIAFDSVEHLIKDVSMGWLFRLAHLNGASFFFLFLFLHISRGLYYSSYHYLETWVLGVVIFFLTIAIAFIGYVLPWGQMSFWGATVITNLISSIPKIGHQVVYWIWGGFSVSAPTLSRFFIIHFCLPFILSGMVILHIYFLHKTGSNNPTNITRKFNLIRFHRFFSFKDIRFFFFWFFIFEVLIFLFPYVLGDPENFLFANSLSTPAHIVPEWYFLFAYAILRSIPRKLGGVISLVLAVLILIFPTLLNIRLKGKNYLELLGGKIIGSIWIISKQSSIWIFLSIFILLTWIGGEVVEDPFIFIGQFFLIFYFLFFFILRV